MSTPTPIDLTNCDREPIHIPGSVQPHGVLVALRASDLSVTQVSANAEKLLGVGADVARAGGLAALIDPADLPRVMAALRDLADAAADRSDVARPTYLMTVRTTGGDRAYDAIAHRVGDRAVLELEPARRTADAPGPELYRLVQGSIVGMQRAETLAGMFDACAREVRRVNGFDRVMVYRFDAEWNGAVIAEDRRPDLEPFLGLHYPASDIPRQARELYTRNLLRFIADRDYVPSPLVPPAEPGGDGDSVGRPLDMSHAVLRSVSPVHLEYLRNMGVGASMSISLLRDGQLWGLIACHHYAPRYVPYDVRTACELLGQVLSMQLVSKDRQEQAAYGRQMEAVRVGLAERLDQSADVAAALTGTDPTLLDLLRATGAAVVIGDRVTRVGQTPGPDDVLRIAAWVAAETRAAAGASGEAAGDAAGEVVATDHLGGVMNAGSGLALTAAGVLAVPVTRDGRFQVLWFRPEQVRTVHWAGDPAKSVTKGDDGVRLSPRGSFALWKQTVRGRSDPWTAAERAAAADLRRSVVGVLLRRAEELAHQNMSLRLATEEKERQLDSERSARGEVERVSRMKDEFVATLSHELRTPLNAILGWSQLLRRSIAAGAGIADAAETIDVIERNARAQAQMIEDLLDVSRITTGKLRLDVQPVNLGAVVDAAVASVVPAAAAKGIRFDRLIDPLPGLEVSGDPSRLQQVVWNLLSNAVKFTPKGGRVRVTLQRLESNLELSVSDSGQGIRPAFLPHVFDRFRQEDGAANRKHGGLGLGLAIVRQLVELHGGAVHAESAGEGCGATFVVSLPLRAVRQPGGGPHPTAQPAGVTVDCDAVDLAGTRVLVVDDEPDARELVRRLLTECRVAVTAVGSAADAMAAFRAGPAFDVIVSDIGMPGEDGYALIAQVRRLEEELGRRRTPAVALTAYARPDDRRRIMLAGYQVHVPKPVEAAELTAVVANLAGRI
ncbi:MAG: cph [Phycisphaerales bacterium]|nr:cph [Phycisphaerales bacterium]